MMAQGTYSTKFACDRMATSSGEGDPDSDPDVVEDDDEPSPSEIRSFLRQPMTRAESRP
jgi:hypothetical protein